jgi:hypothetical protein
MSKKLRLNISTGKQRVSHELLLTVVRIIYKSGREYPQNGGLFWEMEQNR